MTPNKTGDGTNSPENAKKPLNSGKQDRLAAALRENLRKRKQQAAARKDGGGPD